MKKIITCAVSFLASALTTSVVAQTTSNFEPDGFVTISENSGGFTGQLDSGDRFSRDHDVVGDIDNDGILDLVIGARSDDDGETDAGAAYILFMNSDGTVKSNQKISMTEGGFNETLVPGNFFGYGVAGIGDYNNDNIPDIAVSAPTAANRAIYIIHLNRNGTVKSFVKNSGIAAQGLSAIGDLDGDGKIDLVACNPGSDIGGTNRGAIDILFFNNNSLVRNNRTVTIASDTGGFGTGLTNEDSFGGREVAMLGDIDGDGNKEMAVGSFTADGGKGAIWILSLDNSNYNVISKTKIAEGLNGFDEVLSDELNPNGTSGAQLGHAMCSPGDLNGDGINDLITGANQQNEGWLYIIYLNADKTVKSFTRINNNEGGYDLTLDTDERFSRSLSFIGDLKGDGSIAVNVGGGAGGTGTLYLLFLKSCDFIQEPGFNFWTGGTTLFSNWSHANQLVTGPLSFEACALKAQETDAAYITFKESDGRCICKAEDAVLSVSDEESSAFINTCYSEYTESEENENIAIGGTATQSSTNHGGNPQRAIDGNTSGLWSEGSITHTQTELNPWWQVDLGTTESIGDIVIWNRTNCCSDRLTNFTVSVLDANNTITYTQSYNAYPNPSITVNANGALGSIVRIQLDDTSALPLSLAEVEIYNGSNTSFYTKIEAEDFVAMNGIQTENTQNENPQSLNVGYIDTGDWMDYNINVPSPGTYTINTRVATLRNSAEFQFQVNGEVLNTINMSTTSGWQNWTTLSTSVQLEAGAQTLRIFSVGNNFNINWFEITNETSATANKTVLIPVTEITNTFNIYPVPVQNELYFETTNPASILNVEIVDMHGRVILSQSGITDLKTQLDTSSLSNGMYIFRIFDKNTLEFTTIQFVK